MKNTICIIPAKSKSKRIINKNLLTINKKPMIAHVIKNAIKSKCFKEIFISTDSAKIKNIGLKYGAKVPFIRSKNLSNADVGIYDVIYDAIKKIKTNYNYKYVCYIFPTSILVNSKLIKKYFKLFIKSNKDFSINVKEFSHPVERAFKIKADKIILNTIKFKKQTQKFQKSFYDTGEIYFAKKTSFLKKKNSSNSKYKFILSDSNHIDLDEPKDLKSLKKIFKDC